MITTVTTTTTTVTPIIVVALIVFLTAKELVGASLSPSHQLIARFLNVGILPLIMAFAVVVAVKIAEILA